MITLAAYFLGGFAGSLALTPVCRAAARRLGYVAGPKQDRWHQQPTPLLGGVAIALTVLCGSLSVRPLSEIALLLACSAAIFCVGLLDDLLTLKPSSKLVAEIAVASVLVFFGYRLEWSSSLTLDTMLSLIWIVGITNALNLLDNMDGLCAGIALIAGFAILAGADGVTPATLHLALMLGATAGFLVYNLHPASIFMGDSGSLFLGVALAGLTLDLRPEIGDRSNILSIVAVPVLVLLIPIFDTTLVTVSRLLSRRRASQGGRDHSSHRLVAIGLSERRAVAVLWTLGALGGLIGWTFHERAAGWLALTGPLFVLAMVIFAVYLAHVRVYENADLALLREGKITPFLIQFMYKRRVAEILLDLCLVSLAYYGAYRLRFEGEEFTGYFPYFLKSFPIVVGIQIVALFAVGAYRGVWRYFSLMDGVVMAKGVLLGTAAVVCFVLYFYRFANYSRGVFVIYAALLMLFLTGSRASFRLISEFVQRRRGGARLIIYGAGSGGSLAARELLNSQGPAYRMLGFIDDEPKKLGTRVYGYPILGGYESLLSLVNGGAVDVIVISVRAIDAERLRALELLCAQQRVRLSRLHFSLEPLVAVS